MDKLHELLKEAKEKYYQAIKYLSPYSNVAHLKEKKELDYILLIHNAQCGCESSIQPRHILETYK